jgi:hypothetical protein
LVIAQKTKNDWITINSHRKERNKNHSLSLKTQRPQSFASFAKYFVTLAVKNPQQH